MARVESGYQDLRGFVRKIYRDFVEKDPSVPSELRRALRAHERVPRFIDNMSKQLNAVSSRVKRENVELAVRDMSRIFVDSVKRAAEDKALSPLERARRIQRDADNDAFRVQAEKLIAKSEAAENVESGPKGVTISSEIDAGEFV